MTFLPIVERELRVASRRRAIYWTRMLIALLAMVIGGVILLVNLGAPQSILGDYIFIGLSVLAFIYCLLSGRRSTADCLSEEKRDGTLGLLFLTDLNGYDVVLGKLVATSLSAFYGLLAVFPVLAIPLLLGGVTNGELWRMVLVLVVTFLFSLAIGILASALSRDVRKAMALNFALLLLFTGVLPAGAAIIALTTAAHIVVPQLFFTSPIYVFYLCADVRYKIEPEHFLISVGIIHGLTWLFVIQASRILPHSWQDQPAVPAAPAKARWHRLWRAWGYGPREKQGLFRKQLLDVNAFYWLAARVRLKPVHVWTFLAFIGLWWLQGFITSGAMWLDESVNVTLALLLNGTLKLWVAQEAGQRLAEDKKIGALELLLSTPLTVRDILRGQWLALRRQFLKPILAVLGIEFVLMEISMRYTNHAASEIRVIWFAGMVMLLADLFTLGLVAMARALTAKTQSLAIIATLFQILALPWLAFGLVVTAANVWFTLLSPSLWIPGWKFHLGWWFALGIFTDFFFGLQAWWLLHHRMRHYALQRYAPPSGSEGWFFRRKKIPPKPTSTQSIDAPAPSASVRLPRKSWRRKTVVLASLLMVLLFLLYLGSFLRTPPPKFPPPVLIPISLSQGPLRVFPGRQVVT